MAEAQKVLVLDVVPACAQGVTHALRARGFDAVVGSVGQFEPHEDVPVLVALRTPDDWAFLRSHGAVGDRCVVAMLSDADEYQYRRALGGGARSAVSERAPVDEIVRVFEAALDRRALLPDWIAAAMAMTGSEVGGERPQLTTAETRWLHALAAGNTVAEIAVQSCYSQREMYRLFRQMYARMGARNRADAIVLATKWGVI